jgi:3',5'-cyclic AMP phosphodiesterase CpdA
VCTDEHLLFPDPYATRAEWCRVRVAESARRLDAIDPTLPTVLVNHWPLTRLPTRVLRYPEFALWCGTEATADWHVRYRATAVVYGHLHIPRVIVEDGVRFVEASLGYPREWKPREERYGRINDLLPRQVLPA